MRKRRKYWMLLLGGLLACLMGQPSMVQAAEQFTINGIDVLSADPEDVLGTYDGDAKTVRYDAVNNTLILEHADLRGESGAVIYNGETPLVIELIGESHVSEITTYGSLYLQGDGKLNANGIVSYEQGDITISGDVEVNLDNAATALTSNGDLTLSKGVRINATSRDGMGVSVAGDLLIDGEANIIAKGDYAGLLCNNQVTITNSAIVDAFAQSGAGLHIEGALTINGDAQVTARSAATNDGPGLYSVGNTTISGNASVQATSQSSYGLYIATGTLTIGDNAKVSGSGTNGLGTMLAVTIQGNATVDFVGTSGDGIAVLVGDITIGDNAQVTAKGTQRGLSSLGKIMINGGVVIAEGSSKSIIGEKSTSVKNAYLILSEKKPDALAFVPTNSVLITGTSGAVYGDVILSREVTVPEGTTLTVSENSTITLEDGAELVNNGRIINAGTIDSVDKVTGNGTWGVFDLSLDETCSMYPGDTRTLTVTPKPAYADLSPIHWQSDNTDVIEVSGNGQTISLKAKDTGKATVSASIDGVTASCIVTVNALTPPMPTYTITIPDNLEGGSIKSSHVFAVAGARVTLTVQPEEGYHLDVLTVTDSKGNPVTFKQASDRRYTFTMPKSEVSVDARFVKEHEAGDALPFKDISVDAWYYDAVKDAYQSGLMVGTDATHFSPLMSTNRGMIVTMLYRLAGSPSLENEILGYPYEDVVANAYYADAVYWARMNDIVSGYSDEKFGPNDPITREQLAGMLMRYSKWSGNDTSQRSDISRFKDADSVSPWAKEAVQWAHAEGLINGVGDATLAPQGQASRAQVAAIFTRFVAK